MDTEIKAPLVLFVSGVAVFGAAKFFAGGTETAVVFLIALSLVILFQVIFSIVGLYLAAAIGGIGLWIAGDRHP